MIGGEGIRSLGVCVIDIVGLDDSFSDDIGIDSEAESVLAEGADNKGLIVCAVSEI